ncbi:hypothetical protein EON65_12055 [archaeon]|nr:MAG: hypothetical protein EON65_12055 [archaeon]
MVGVINKFGKQPEPHSLTFTEFYSGFKHTKLKERQRFSSVFGAKGREAEDKVLSSFCTTPALFRSIDSILLMQLKKNFEISFQTLKDCLTDKLSLLYAQCPIPSRYYLKGKERRKSSILRKISFGHLIEEFVTNARRNMGSNLDNFYLDNLDKWFKKLQILSDSGAITFNIVLGKHAELEKYRQWIEEVKKDWLTVLQQVKVDNLNIFSYQSLHAPCRFPELQRAVHCALSEDLPPVLQNLEKKGLKYVDEVVHGQYVAAGEDGMRAAQHSLRILLTWVVDDVGQLLRGAVDSLTSRIDTAAVARLLAEDKAVFARRVEIYFSIGQLLMQLHTLEDCLNGSGTGEGRMDYICSRLLKGYMQLQEVTESLPFDVEDVIWAVYVQSRTSKQRGKKSSFEQTATEELLKLLKVKTDLSSRALSPSSHLPLRSCNKPQNTANNFVDILGSNDDEYGESSSNCDSKFESSDDREESDMEVDEGKDERSEFPLSVVQVYYFPCDLNVLTLFVISLCVGVRTRNVRRLLIFYLSMVMSETMIILPPLQRTSSCSFLTSRRKGIAEAPNDCDHPYETE